MFAESGVANGRIRTSFKKKHCSHHQPDVGSRFNDTIPSFLLLFLAFLRLLLLAFLAIDIIDPSSTHSMPQSISLDSLIPLEDSASILTWN